MFKNNKITVLVLGLLFILALSSPCLSSSEMEMAEIYNNKIEEQIASCHAKVRFIDSRSNNLHQYCELELRKAEFLINSRDILLMEMIEEQIPAKDYKIRYFLNSHFYEAVSD